LPARLLPAHLLGLLQRVSESGFGLLVAALLVSLFAGLALFRPCRVGFSRFGFSLFGFWVLRRSGLEGGGPSASEVAENHQRGQQQMLPRGRIPDRTSLDQRKCPHKECPHKRGGQV